MTCMSYQRLTLFLHFGTWIFKISTKCLVSLVMELAVGVRVVVRVLATKWKLRNRVASRAINLMERVRENPNGFLPILHRTLAVIIQWKLDCWSCKQKQKNKSLTVPVLRPFWYSLLLASSTTQFSLDHKWLCHKQQRYFSSTSNSLIFTRSYCFVLIIMTLTPSKWKPT